MTPVAPRAAGGPPDFFERWARSGWWLLPILLLIWFVTQRYEGIYHDAELYTFQALARLHPDLLGQDLFLRYGSQDRFTLFSPLYATLIQIAGIENAAKILTISMQVGLLVAIGALARALRLRTGPALALCAAVCLPPVYGTGEYFHFLENFVTPRMAGEALSLVAVGCALNGRWYQSATWLLAAFTLHPIIALAGLVFLAFWRLLALGWRMLAGACAGGALLIALLALFPSLRQDDAWHFAVRESLGYLFVSSWSFSGFAQTLLPLLILGAASLHPDVRMRRLALAALATGVAGLAGSVIGADCLHLTIFVQAQLWRWMWLAALLAALVAPETAITLWNQGPAGRCAVLLLASDYLLAPSSTLLVAVPLTVLALVAARAGVGASAPARRWRLILLGATGIAALGALANLAQKALLIVTFLKEARVTGIDERINTLTADGVLPVLLVLSFVWLWRAGRSNRARTTALLAATIVALFGGLFYLRSFAAGGYPQELRASARAWQALIPPGSEVFIPEDPMVGWTLLLRPGYFSLHQAVSEVFSREASMEGRRRALATTWFLSAHKLQPWEDLRADVDRAPTLRELCRKAEFQFVVSRFDMDAEPIGTVSADAPSWVRTIRLYACPPTPSKAAED